MAWNKKESQQERSEVKTLYYQICSKCVQPYWYTMLECPRCGKHSHGNYVETANSCPQTMKRYISKTSLDINYPKGLIVNCYKCQAQNKGECLKIGHYGCKSECESCKCARCCVASKKEDEKLKEK